MDLLAVDAGWALNQQSRFCKVQPGVPSVERDAHVIQLQTQTQVRLFNWGFKFRLWTCQSAVSDVIIQVLLLLNSRWALTPHRCPSSWWALWLAAAGEQICSLWTPWRLLCDALWGETPSQDETNHHRVKILPQSSQVTKWHWENIMWLDFFHFIILIKADI